MTFKGPFPRKPFYDSVLTFQMQKEQSRSGGLSHWRTPTLYCFIEKCYIIWEDILEEKSCIVPGELAHKLKIILHFPNKQMILVGFWPTLTLQIKQVVTDCVWAIAEYAVLQQLLLWP